MGGSGGRNTTSQKEEVACAPGHRLFWRLLRDPTCRCKPLAGREGRRQAAEWPAGAGEGREDGLFCLDTRFSLLL